MKPTSPPQRTSSTIARAYRCLAVVIFLCGGTLATGCSRLAPQKDPELNQDCGLDSSYSEHIRYVHARVMKVVRAHYSSVEADEPGYLQTDYELHPRESPEGDTRDTRYYTRVVVHLSGTGPYKVNVDARAQIEQRVPASRAKRALPNNTPWLREHVRQLRQQIHAQLRDVANNCKGFTVQTGSCGMAPKGGPADLHMPAPLPQSISVSMPEICERGAYIRVERQHLSSQTGPARQLGIGREKGGGFGAGCRKLPKDAKNPSECASINVMTVLHEASRRLQAAGIRANGTGAGPCAKIGDDYDSWDMSVGVLDWRDTERAIQLIAELLEEYNLDGYVGVAVRGIDCGVAL